MKYQNFAYPRVFPVSILGALLLCATHLVAQSASAATGTWTGTNNASSGTNKAFWDSSITNWSGVSGTPWDSVNGLTNDAVFNTGGTPWAFVSGAVYFRNLSFNSSAVLYDNGAGSALNISSNSTVSAASGQAGWLYASIFGSGTLTKSGSGNLTIFNQTGFGANTFNGGVVVNGGILYLNGGAAGRALGSASSYTINSGATIAMQGNDPMGSGPITINGGTLRHETGSAFFQSVGALTLNGGTVLSAQGFGASFQGLALNGNVTVGGSSASTIGTQESVNNGVHLFFNGSNPSQQRTFNVADATGNASPDLTVSASLLNSSHTGTNAGLIKTGAGQMLLTGSNSYAGATTISNGILVFQNKNTRAGGSAVTAAAAGTVGLGVGAGGVSDYSESDVASLFNSTLSGFTLDAASGVAIDTTAGNFTQSTALTAARALTKLGVNTLTLTAANTYSGGTTLGAGTLLVGDDDALGTGTLSVANTSGTTLASDGSTARTLANALAMNAGARVIFGDGTGTGAMTLTGPVSLANGSVQVMTAAVDTTISGLISGTNTGGLVKAGTGVLTLSNTANTFSSPIGVHQGWLRVTKLSDTGVASSIGTSSNSIQLGQVGLEGTLDYIGTGDTVNLQVQIGNGDVGASGGARINNNGSGALVFTNSAFNVNPGAADTAALTRSLTLAGTNTAANEIRGVIANTSSNKVTAVVKGDAGTWVLSGANTYSGATTIGAGTLVAAHASALGGTNVGTTVSSAFPSQLRLNPLANTIFDAEPLTISGQGVTTGGALRNAAFNNTWQGKITLATNATIGAASGTTLTLDVSSGNAIDTTNDANITFDGAGRIVVNDPINLGTGGITKTGSGTTTLVGSLLNSFSGTNTVSLGALVVSNSNLSATISNNSTTVTFPSAPAPANYTILPGPLSATSFGTTNFIGLSPGQTATLTNAPNLIVQVVGSPTANPYADWLTNYPSITNFPGGVSNTNGTADPDGDGFDNNDEFAFGGNPTVGTPALMTVTPVGTNAVFNWIERTNGVIYAVQKNSTLTNAWTAATGLNISNSTITNNVLLAPTYVRKEFIITNATGKDFYRVQATIQP